jgi:hypothetical protein
VPGGEVLSGLLLDLRSNLQSPTVFSVPTPVVTPSAISGGLLDGLLSQLGTRLPLPSGDIIPMPTVTPSAISNGLLGGLLSDLQSGLPVNPTEILQPSQAADLPSDLGGILPGVLSGVGVTGLLTSLPVSEPVSALDPGIFESILGGLPTSLPLGNVASVLNPGVVESILDSLPTSLPAGIVASLWDILSTLIPLSELSSAIESVLESLPTSIPLAEIVSAVDNGIVTSIINSLPSAVASIIGGLPTSLSLETASALGPGVVESILETISTSFPPGDVASAATGAAAKRSTMMAMMGGKGTTRMTATSHLHRLRRPHPHLRFRPCRILLLPPPPTKTGSIPPGPQSPPTHRPSIRIGTEAGPAPPMTKMTNNQTETTEHSSRPRRTKGREIRRATNTTPRTGCTISSLRGILRQTHCLSRMCPATRMIVQASSNNDDVDA